MCWIQKYIISALFQATNNRHVIIILAIIDVLITYFWANSDKINLLKCINRLLKSFVTSAIVILGNWWAKLTIYTCLLFNLSFIFSTIRKTSYIINFHILAKSIHPIIENIIEFGILWIYNYYNTICTILNRWPAIFISDLVWYTFYLLIHPRVEF
jgi:hypothetical protein